MSRDTQLAQVAREVAAELPALYVETGRPNLSEMHHLQPATNRALDRLAPQWNPAPRLTGKTFGEKLEWIGLGHVDAVLHWSETRRTFLELKAGSDLSACVWDAVKLGAGILNGNAADAYLLAAATVDAWTKPCRGSELFGAGSWQTAGDRIRGAYRDWWWAWQEETRRHDGVVTPNPHIPGQVASEFSTIPLGSFPFEINGQPWEVRLARVDPGASTLTAWERVAP